MLVCACNFLELIFPLSPSILSNILPASSEETKQKSVVTIEKTSNFQKWSKQNWDLITDFLIHIWGWYWWLHMQKLLLSSLLKFFSKFQQNVMSILLLCKKIQTFFCNYFSMCTLFWIDLQKTQKKLLIYVLFIPIFDFWYFGPFSCVIFSPFSPSWPSCLTKCKQRLRNIFILSKLRCPKWPKTKNEKWDEGNIRELNSISVI